jgi:DNA mismatch repair protein MutS
MMSQYLEIKAKYPDAVLLYRMGDFYEMFYEDAELASRILGLTLTSRDKGQENAIPLAGIPWHSAEPYIARLLKAGHKIAVCEQVSDVPGKSGLMDRRVVEVLTSGTALQDGLLDSGTNNYVAALRLEGEAIGFAVADISTGEFSTGDVPLPEAASQLQRFAPAEVLVGVDQRDQPSLKTLFKDSRKTLRTELDGWRFDRQRAEARLRERFHLATLAGWDLEDLGPGLGAAGALLDYVREQKQSELPHIQSVRRLRPGTTMILDAMTLRHLEVLEPLLGTDRSTTLLSVLDRTCTAMGARRLRAALRAPLMDLAAVRSRHGVIGTFVEHPTQLGRLRQDLGRIRDMERILGKVTTDRATPRDYGALRDSFMQLPGLPRELQELGNEEAPGYALDVLADLHDVLARAFVDNPPPSLTDLGIIRPGFDQQLDEIREGSVKGREWIASLQETERRTAGIPTLKVGFNKVFGYYLEVTRPHLAKVPGHYTRKQTLVNAERFITPELKEMEEKILGAEEAEKKRQKTILAEIRTGLTDAAARILQTAAQVGELDLLAGWAEVSRHGGYCCPDMTEAASVHIVQGRHPVVESFVGAGQFVANDVRLDHEDRQVQILTGPNMAGKSTFLRQVGLVCLMAQAGCWIPAEAATLGLVDRIFTRVGASDNIALGQSTFLVEMVETSRILHQSTPRSLVLLDEIGRGTSTYDGLAIAWAVAEELGHAEGPRPMVIFATHFHELTRLAGRRDGFLNLNVLVREWNDEVVFLRRVVEGAADRSYGIHVARLAGIPQRVLDRAREVLGHLESRSPGGSPGEIPGGPDEPQPSLFEGRSAPSEPDGSRGVGEAGEPGEPPSHHVVGELLQLDLEGMSPRDAWAWLETWRERLRRRLTGPKEGADS